MSQNQLTTDQLVRFGFIGFTWVVGIVGLAVLWLDDRYLDWRESRARTRQDREGRSGRRGTHRR